MGRWKNKKLGIELKLDFILNHASVLSKQFQDIVAKGEESEYKGFSLLTGINSGRVAEK